MESNAATGVGEAKTVLSIMLGAAAVLAFVRFAGSDLRGIVLSEANTANLSTLSMDFDRMPYLHPNPDGVRYGERRLVGYQFVEDPFRAGRDLSVTLRWEGQSGRGPSWQTELSLVSPAAHLRDVPAAFATDVEDLSGETEFRLDVPASVPPGLHLLRLRVFNAAGEEVLPNGPSGGNGTSLGTTYLRPVRVLPAANLPPFTPEFSMGEDVALGSVQTERLGSDWLHVNLTWQANRPLAANYATSVRLLDRAGERIAAVDAQPCYGFCPTTAWQPGRPIHDRRWLPLPPSFSPGSGHRLEVVLYRRPSLEALGTATLALDSDLSMIEIQRSFEIPEMDRELDVDFGDQVRLLGYDLSRDGVGLDLTLHWQAVRDIDDDYKVFVHLFNPSTEEILAQHDARPLGGAHPTQRWIQGEVVSDAAHLRLDEVPAGVYRVAVGLYAPVTMERLPAVGPDGISLPDGRVILPESIEVPSSRAGIGLRQGGPDIRAKELTAVSIRRPVLVPA